MSNVYHGLETASFQASRRIFQGGHAIWSSTQYMHHRIRLSEIMPPAAGRDRYGATGAGSVLPIKGDHVCTAKHRAVPVGTRRADHWNINVHEFQGSLLRSIFSLRGYKDKHDGMCTRPECGTTAKKVLDPFNEYAR